MLISDFDNKPTTTINEGIRDPNIFKAIFVAGPPGASKNKVIDDLGLIAKGFKLLDIDQTKKYLGRLTDLQRRTVKPDYTTSLRKTLDQKEIYTRNGLGLLINSTCREYEQTMALKKELEGLGYETFMLFIDTEYDVAMIRIKWRELYATDKRDRRPVDMPYFDEAFDQARENIEFYSLMFGNNFAFVTNNVLLDKHIQMTEDREKQTDQIEFQQTFRNAAKKVMQFLRKPLTQKAQEFINFIKQSSSRR